MRDWMAAAAVGSSVTAAILVASGAGVLRPELLAMAVIAGGCFFDLARRGLAEAGLGEGDRTDVWMSASFAGVLVACAWDHGRDLPLGWYGPMEVGLLVVGLCVIALGFGLRHWAAQTLGRDFLVRLDLRDEHQLVESGPFRRIRHPTYAGLLLVALGTAVSFVSPLAVAATIAGWLPAMLLRVHREERLLLARYGGTYESYRRRTWTLIPGLY